MDAGAGEFDGAGTVLMTGTAGVAEDAGAGGGAG